MRHDLILRALAEAGVECIVVGMAAAVLQGVPLTTEDLDIVHRRTPENVARLLSVLTELEAVYRHDPRRLPPTASHLLGAGHQLLRTKHGDLDCLGAIDGDRTYEELEAVSSPLTVEPRLAALRVIDLSALIEIKRRAGRPKDLAVIPYLESTLDELVGSHDAGEG